MRKFFVDGFVVCLGFMVEYVEWVVVRLMLIGCLGIWVVFAWMLGLVFDEIVVWRGLVG